MKLNPYPKYKDSGVEWIGEIPKDWETRKIKHFSENLDGKRIPISAENRMPGQIPYYGATGIVDYVEDYIFDEELLLIGEDGAPFFDSYKDVAFVISGKSWINNHAHVLRVKNGFNIKFMMHILNQADYSLYIKGSTRDKLNQDQLKEIPVLIPPKYEQKSIASFLDKKTSEIDKTIKKDTQLIELLKEKRAALINHVVTKGLDPEIPMKKVSNGWISEIPKNWDVVKAKRFCKILTGGTPRKEILSYWENGTINWMTSGEVNKRRIKETKSKITKDGLNNSNARMLPKNSIMMALSGQGKTKGMVATLDVPTCCSQSLGAFVCDEINVHYNYLFYYLMSRYLDIRWLVGNTEREGLSLAIIGDIYILIPPFEDQKKLASYLDKETTKIDQTIQKIQTNISLLQEYKKSLIHHAVTGKIDVRGV